MNAVTPGRGRPRGDDRAKTANPDPTTHPADLDEIHRFNRSQQDALLPDVERGLIT